MNNIINKIKSQQKANLFYFKYFTRHVSVYLSFLFIKFKISPNLITFFMFFPGILGAYFLKFGSPSGYILAGFFLILHDILDTSDGEVARYLEKNTLFGLILDNLIHLVTNSSIVFFLIVGFFNIYQTNFDQYVYHFAIPMTFVCIILEFIKILHKLCLSITNSKLDNDINKGIKFKINDIFLGNVAFFHLIVFLSFIDYLIFSKSYLLSIYLSVYCILIIYKLYFKVLSSYKIFS